LCGGFAGGHTDQQLDTLYVTGGAAELPPVARILRESFGRKVRRSAYMRSASAIGLAIRASTTWRSKGRPVCRSSSIAILVMAPRRITVERFSRSDFPRGVQLPSSSEQPLRVERIYRPRTISAISVIWKVRSLTSKCSRRARLATGIRSCFRSMFELQKHSDLATVLSR